LTDAINININVMMDILANFFILVLE